MTFRPFFCHCLPIISICRRDHSTPSVLFDDSGPFMSVYFKSHQIYEPFAAFWWLLFNHGNPVCILPHQGDMTGLESRSYAETIRLIDEWTKYDMPKESPSYSVVSSSASVSPQVSSPSYSICRKVRDSDDYIGACPSQAMSGSDFDIYSQAPPFVHIIGGEVVFWLFGRVYKFDGLGSKLTHGPPTLMWGCYDDSVVIG